MVSKKRKRVSYSVAFKLERLQEIANGINEFFDKDLSSRYIERVRGLKKELSWTELARDIIAFYEMIKRIKSKH